MSIENGISRATAPRRGAMSNKWQLALLRTIYAELWVDKHSDSGEQHTTT